MSPVLSEPPVPHARRPLRRYEPKETEFHALNRSKESQTDMHSPKQREYSNKYYNYDLQYTDTGTDMDSETEDDEYDDEDDEDNEDLELDETDDASWNHRLSNSHSLSFERKAARSSPIETAVRRKNDSKLNASRSPHVTSTPVSLGTKRRQVQKLSAEISNGSKILLSITVGIVLFATFSFIRAMPRKNESDVTVDENKLEVTQLIEAKKKLVKSVDVIRSRFQNQRANIWNDISASIYDVALFPTRPSIIILFGNETETLNCLAQLLAEVSGNILGSNDHLTLMSNDFPNDVGRVIDTLKQRIEQKKAVVIQDLLSINTEAIRAFHNFCDREKPLVGHAIYIITIIVDGYETSSKELRFVDKQIYKKLKGHIDEDIISPLIIRLTDGVVAPILPELNKKFNNSYCSLPLIEKM